MTQLGLLGLQLCVWLAMSIVITQLAIALHRHWRWPADRPSYWWSTLAVVLVPPLAAWLMPAPLLPTPLLELVDPGIGAAVAGAPSAAISIEQSEFSSFSLLAAVGTIYLIGLVFLTTQRHVQKRRLRHLMRNSLPLSFSALPGPRSARLVRALQRRGIALRSLGAPLSPFALQWPRPLIVLPDNLLQRLSDDQCWLLLRHECAHLRHRDALSFSALRWLCAVLWFNPALWQLSRRLRLACELRCDRRALGQRKNMRRVYAEAYLETLRMSATRALPCPAAAFSTHDLGHQKMRISHILSSPPAAGKSKRCLALLIAASTAFGLSAVHASGWTAEASAESTASTGSAAAPALQGPIIVGRISSGYGTQRPKLSSVPHRGVDLVARRGTPVHSAAAGVVITAESPYSEAPRYGNVVVVDHGGGWQTLYAHLDSIVVSSGDRVEAGQVLGGLGSSGQATGPHVHVEVFNAGQRLDPQLAISNLIGER